MNPLNWGSEEWKGAAEAFAGCGAVMFAGWCILWLVSILGGAA